MVWKGAARRKQMGKEREVEVREDSLSNSLTSWPQMNLVASGQTNGTNTQQVSTDTNSEITPISTKVTSEQLTLVLSQTTTLSLEDFLAKVSALLASGEDLKILEAHYSLKSAESLGLRELSIYYLRTLKDSSITIRETHTKPLSERWMNWGMTVNGRCLTARTSECHRTEKGCSFLPNEKILDIYKYFL